MGGIASFFGLDMKAFTLLCVVCVGAVLAAPPQQKPQAASRKPLSAGGASRRLLSQSVTSISPTYGSMEGNSLVMVVGTGFDSITAAQTKECQFGTSKTTATVINATHISCRTPKRSTGAATFTLFPTQFVSDFKTSAVLRYNADTGAFIDVFV